MSRARLVVESGKREGHAVELGDGPAFVGRLAACELAIEEAQASRKHFSVERRGDEWFARDLDSKNGTYLNETRLAGEARLAPGDVLRVGDTRVRFELASPGERPASPGERQAPEKKRLGPGTMLGPYEVGEAVARTVEGTIHRARHVSLDRPARVLVLASELGADARAREGFLARARGAAAFDHPALLAVFDAGEEAGSAWAVLEEFEGEPLHVLLERSPPDPAEAVLILASVAAALAHVHGRGGVHGRVGPSAVLVGEGHAKLGFPIAEDGPRLDLEAKNAFERARWASPEEARGLEPTRASDVWSLGLLAYRVLADDLPFSARSLPELLRELASPEPLPGITERVPGLPGAAGEVLARLLAKTASERITAQAAEGELRRLATALRAAPAKAPAPKAGTRSSAKKKPSSAPELEPARQAGPAARPAARQAAESDADDHDHDEDEGAVEEVAKLDPVRALVLGLLLFLLFAASTKLTRVVLLLIDPPAPRYVRSE